MMDERVVRHAEQPRRSLRRMKVFTPALALLVGSVALAEWACAPRSRTAPAIDPRVATAALAAAPAPQQTQPEVQPAPAPAPPPASLAQLDAQMATAMRVPTEAEVERRIEEEVARRTAERTREAAAAAFPVTRRLEMSSTMYCLKGHMRTGVRTSPMTTSMTASLCKQRACTENDAKPRELRCNARLCHFAITGESPRASAIQSR